MTEWYIARGVSIADLAVALRDSRLRWIYAERAEGVALTLHEAWLAGQVSLDRWIHGRAFGAELELAWWQKENSIETRAIVVKGDKPQGIKWEILPTEGWEAQSLQEKLLVGERDPNAPAEHPQWSTVRIPHYLEYPVDGRAQRVALVEQLYWQRGIVVASRLVEIKEAAYG